MRHHRPASLPSPVTTVGIIHHHKFTTASVSVLGKSVTVLTNFSSIIFLLRFLISHSPNLLSISPKFIEIFDVVKVFGVEYKLLKVLELCTGGVR